MRVAVVISGNAFVPTDKFPRLREGARRHVVVQRSRELNATCVLRFNEGSFFFLAVKVLKVWSAAAERLRCAPLPKAWLHPEKQQFLRDLA